MIQFRDLPKSLQDKLTSGKPWVVAPEEREILYKYLNGLKVPRFLPGGIVQPGDMLRTVQAAIDGGAESRLPQGPTNAPGNWYDLAVILDPDRLVRILRNVEDEGT